MEVKQLFFSGACFFCLTKTVDAWCRDCERDFINEKPRCPVCARHSLHKDICGSCLIQQPPFSSAEVLFDYQYPADQLIKAFKFNNRPELASRFADVLAKKLTKKEVVLPDVIVPVPLHKNRQQERGYNQSLELAKQLGRQLGVKVSFSQCSRTINTDPQSTLPMKTRRKNVIGAFSLSKSKIPEHIAIVDDVITTGSTVSELSRLFKKAGCQQIDIWAIART
jgi:ComF family protein